MILKKDEAAHWYYPDGRACHQVERAKPTPDGKTMRDTNLADARKLGLIPSVTTVLQLHAKEILTTWKIEQAIKASMRLRQDPSETPEDFIRRVEKESGEQTRAAADFGTVMHMATEDYAIDPNYVCKNPLIQAHFEHWADWWDQNVIECFYVEKVVIGDGYAGRLDIKANIKGHGVKICDVKTRASKLSPVKADPNRRKMSVYDDDGLQLSAYEQADRIACQKNGTPPASGCLSLLIDRDIPSPPHVHEWPEEEMKRYYRAFAGFTTAWAYLKNYNPQAAQNETDTV